MPRMHLQQQQQQQQQQRELIHFYAETMSS